MNFLSTFFLYEFILQVKTVFQVNFSVYSIFFLDFMI